MAVTTVQLASSGKTVGVSDCRSNRCSFGPECRLEIEAPPLERRQHRRVAIDLDVELQGADDDGLVACVSRDISLGGACVRGRRRDGVSGTVFVVLSAGDQLFVAIGKVLEPTVAVDDSTVEMRIRFDRVSPKTKERLSRFLTTVSGGL